jgi:hypothetical protein
MFCTACPAAPLVAYQRQAGFIDETLFLAFWALFYYSSVFPNRGTGKRSSLPRGDVGMSRIWWRAGLGAIVVVALLSFLSCGHDEKLISIAVTPDGASISGSGVLVHYVATGTYIHPPENKDLTNSVVWASAAPQVIDFLPNTGAGVATTGTACGTNITITATAYSNPQSKSGSVVVGTAAVTVSQPGIC